MSQCSEATPVYSYAYLHYIGICSRPRFRGLVDSALASHPRADVTISFPVLIQQNREQGAEAKSHSDCRQVQTGHSCIVESISRSFLLEA